MRRQFIVTGFKVTENNMSTIAAWCGGHVVRDAPQPYVRVPVERFITTKQTQAFVDNWVLVSVRRGQQVFKVYTQHRLDQDFLLFEDEVLDLVVNDIPDTEPVLLETCCNHHHHATTEPTRSMPPPQRATPATVFQSPQYSETRR